MRACLFFVALLLTVTTACQRAEAVERVIVEELVQAGDSVKYRVTWTAPATDAQHPAPTGYHVRLVRDSSLVKVGGRVDTLVFHQITNRLVDTVTMARPLLVSDSVPLRIVVRSVACAATPCGMSPFVSTGAWFLRFRTLVPNSPGGVIVDTLALAVDSVYVRPLVVATTIGASVQLCAFGKLKDGTRGMFPFGRVDNGPLVAQDTLGYCLDQFNRWLTEVQA